MTTEKYTILRTSIVTGKYIIPRIWFRDIRGYTLFTSNIVGQMWLKGFFKRFNLTSATYRRNYLPLITVVISYVINGRRESIIRTSKRFVV